MIYELSLAKWNAIYAYLEECDPEENDYPGSVNSYLHREYKLRYLYNDTDHYLVEDEMLFAAFLLRWS